METKANNAKGEATKKAVKAEPKTVVYMGVSIPGTTLSHGNIYNNGYPNEVKNLMEVVPEIKPLMVEVSKVIDFKKELKVKGSQAATLALRLIKRLKTNY